MARRDQLAMRPLGSGLGDGSVAAHLAFETGVEEVFDVQVLPEIIFPHISGPWAERDTGRPFWTVPPP